MEVACPSCKKKINIPDEKIPKKGAVTFSCPACKGKITVGAKNAAPPPAKAKAPVKKEAAAPPSGESLNPESEKPGALLCHTEPAKLKKMLEGMGYQVHTPGYHIQAINDMRFNQYKVIIITNGYMGLPQDQGSILETVQNLTMDKRRNTFIAYIAPGLKSFNELEAYSQSVDAIISSEDIEKEGIQKKLVSEIKEHEKFSKVYNEIKVELGKA